MKRLMSIVLSVLLVLSSLTVAYSAKGGKPGAPDKIPVTGVNIETSEIVLQLNESYSLNVEIEPSNASNLAVRWKSSNKKHVTVTSDGTVTAIKPGEAEITVTTVDGKHTDTCTVTVRQLPNWDVSGYWPLDFDCGSIPPCAAFKDLVQDENGNISGLYGLLNGSTFSEGGPVEGYVSGDSVYLYYERESGYCGEFIGTIDKDGISGSFESFTTGYTGNWFTVDGEPIPLYIPSIFDVSGDWWLTFNNASEPDAAFNDLIQDASSNVTGEYWTYNGGVPVYGGPVEGYVSEDYLYLYYERESGYHGVFEATIDSDGMTGTFVSYSTPFTGTWVAVRTPQLPFD